MAKHAKKVEKRSCNAVRRPSRAPETRDGANGNRHYEQAGAPLDRPAPQRDPELGIGKYLAWQTPIHREAVRRALKEIT